MKRRSTLQPGNFNVGQPALFQKAQQQVVEEA
jgi:hypothetical protein